MKRTLITLTLAALACFASHAQSQGSTLLLSGSAGSQTTLGYHLPSLIFGVGAEIPVGEYFEFIGSAAWSPDHKSHTTWPQNNFLSDARALLWFNHRFAIEAGARYTKSWQAGSQEKFQLYPLAGISIRDHWGDLPGRADITYEFPTGDLNRLEGGRLYQSFRVASRLRVGLDVGVWEFRSFPVDGHKHWAYTSAMRLDIEIRSHGGIY